MTNPLAGAVIGMLLCGSAAAGELRSLLLDTLQHPQIRAARTQADAAELAGHAAAGKYYGAAVLSSGWRRYEDQRTVGVAAAGRTEPALSADSIVQTNLSYSLPVDVFGVIAASKARAQHDWRAAGLLARQQALLKLHQAASAYFALQTLLLQRQALELASKRIEATHARVRKAFELGKAAGVDARYAESEVARLRADQAQLGGAVAQAQADLGEATGRADFMPAAIDVRVPKWHASADPALPVRIAQARSQAAQAQADESRRALLPAFSLDLNASRNRIPGGDRRDNWAVGGTVVVPLSVAQHRLAGAQKLSAAAAAEQTEAALRDAGRNLASLRARYESGLAEAAAIESEVAYREDVAHVEQSMHRLGNQTLENLFRHERDLLDARYRLASAKVAAAAAWSAAQVVTGLPVNTYIDLMDAN